jgi:cell division protein FtsI (penicillin-binding protein 3)
MRQTNSNGVNEILRVRFWYALLLIVCCLFLVRLFHLQIIKHDHYRAEALSGQLKQYEIPAKRGVIEAYNGEDTVPIVLNETKFLLYADPVFITDPATTAAKLKGVLGGDESGYQELMKTPNTRYVVMAKNLDESIKNAIEELELKGVGLRPVELRTYPQGELASQLLGFVNDDGEGKYGVEQALDEVLSGTSGQLKAITDVRGIPLASNKENVLIEPQDGQRITLTVDIGMQQNLEDILEEGIERAIAERGSAVVMNVNDGSIKAMANYPTYNPEKFREVKDIDVFNNAVVSEALEIGSVMKPLTVAAAIDSGVVNRNSSYNDVGSVSLDGAVITNAEALTGQTTVGDILYMSMNTGTTWLLSQMGGGSINEQARTTWHRYMTEHYRLGQITGVEQGFESAGLVPDPKVGDGLNIRYANTTFGQGMMATPLQLAAAMAAVVNGGNYYQPRLLSAKSDEAGEQVKQPPKLLKSGIVSQEGSQVVRDFMEKIVTDKLPSAARQGYAIGGKTGTAEIARAEGGYYKGRYNGMYVGYVGLEKPEYIIVVKVEDPKIAGYAGTRAAAPIFADITNMIIDNNGF